ncbi:ABC transporter ATP-binding protein [Dehalococcoides mccartyi]|uniref:ABC-2 type transport system, ATP-binding protein n=1 Tax=Dehalococcoides mccartyi (strain VS) TaxID=311424 RepID=D2BGR0_DEHMV|nr:ABC transporter ATP-binding protein [Dehalococcoides mccartyi]ACZ61510.1 ABC-2 type transport system, ATP-binding protein [Dehalococcoides mccartyi VS]
MNTHAIKVSNLVKRYKDCTALDGLSLEIKQGECFGLLGPNGAGKTTLVRILTSLTPSDSGTVEVMGLDLAHHLRQIKAMFGVIPQLDNLDSELSVTENLVTFARFFDIKPADARRKASEILHLFKLEQKANSEVKALSGGMRRRLLLARGLMNNPSIIILDEPSVGLDPQSKYLVWQKLKEFKACGITQLLTTQNMDEAAVLCDRIAIMHQGKVLDMDTPKGLVDRHVGQCLIEIEVRQGEHEAITAECIRRGLDFEDSGLIIQVFRCGEDNLLDELKAFGWNVWQRIGTLEDVFLRLTGKGLVE